jgi:hypothetical protein
MNNEDIHDVFESLEEQAYQDKKRIDSFLKSVTFEKLYNVLNVRTSKFEKLTVKTNDSKSTEDHLNHIEKYVEINFKGIQYGFALNKTELTIYIDTKRYTTEKLLKHELNFKEFTIKILLTILKTQ